jgi:hypothetical protein
MTVMPTAVKQAYRPGLSLVSIAPERSAADLPICRSVLTSED